MRPALGRLRRRLSVPEFVNDLEPPVFRRYPELAAVRDRLKQSGALLAGLSGSGSAVFGLFAQRPRPDDWLHEESRRGWTFHCCRTLDAEAYQQHMGA